MLEHLDRLLPAIFSVADQGAAFQGKVAEHQKSATGNRLTDVVTEADLWVQHQLLELFVDTPLKNCQLVAEESSAVLQSLQARFTGDSGYQLFLDPIDGTRRFLDGLPYFSCILTLQRQRQPLYTLCYYPRLNWWLQIVENQVATSGPVPLEHPALPTTVCYTAGDPQRDFRDWLTPAMSWVYGSGLHPAGSKLLYLSGAVAGYACFNPNLYDGLMMYHYAKAKNHELFDELDLQRWEHGPQGLFVPGRYLCRQVVPC